MKLTLYMYVAQPRKGHYEVSMPWVAQLAEPLRGPSPAQLKEELMFKLLELVHGGMEPDQLDRLLPPHRPYLTSLYLEVERQIDPDRPAARMSATTHVIVGGWESDAITRVWLPRVPGVALALRKIDDMYATVNFWVREHADSALLENLDALQCSFVAGIESMELDLGYPLPGLSQDESGLPGGRLTRPENLQQVATNLSHRAEDGMLPAAYGREKLVEDLVEVLTSSSPANICLVGPPGVGKTALIHEAARRAWALARAYQERCDVWQTSGDRVIAGMSIIGQWEQRTEAICRELAERGDYLFAESLLGLIQAGRTSQGDSSVARFIEPYLDQEQLGIITEATEETYALARSASPGFVDKFRRIQVPELTYEETLSVLGELIRHLEGVHNEIRFTPDGVESLLQLSRRFFKQTAFPGKAVRLVKQCLYHGLRLSNEADVEDHEVLQRINAQMVAEVVHRQTGLPMTILRPGTGRTPETIRRTFEARVFGQPDAVAAVTSLVLTIEQGLSDPNRPLGSFLLIGPSGVGKTETAKALAEDLFGSAERMIRFDMSEFSESVAISRLIGTSRDPDGELTSKVRLQPFCVLLFDEIEKAHPLVLDLLLQILGDGRLTDAAGRVVDFRNAVVLMTSNLGAGSEDRWLGFSDANGRDRTLHYRRAAEGFFRPEIFNRIDKVIPYKPLGSEALRKIARRTLQSLLDRRGLRQAQVMVDVDEGLIDFLAENSVDRRYGARTLSHRIERQLITPLARKLARHQPDVGLTRVMLTPSADGISLDLEALRRAPAYDGVTPIDQFESDVNSLVARLQFIGEGIEDIGDDPRFELLQGEYARILDDLNTVASEGGDTAPFAEDLHQRESFLDRVETVDRRIHGLLDPHGSGEFLFTMHADESKARTHRIAKIARELSRELIWLQVQLEDLTAPDFAGSTLIVAGLGGPYGNFLSRWHRWVEVLSDALELEFAFAYHTGDGWRGESSRPTDLGSLTAFAASSETAGVGAIFDALAGYLWSPRAVSAGQHALLLGTAIDHGTSAPGPLVELLRERGIPRDRDQCVEFVEENGQLEDLRLGRRFAIPDDRGTNLQEFVSRIVMTRVAAKRAQDIVSS